VFGKLQSSGGFTAPNSQSQQSSNVATAAFGQDAGERRGAVHQPDAERALAGLPRRA